MFGMAPGAADARAQIERVEELSDAYHLQVGERDVVVAYLLEITARAKTTNGGIGPPRARRR
jgi:hypothetical protein